jgi:hypothetical protein
MGVPVSASSEKGFMPTAMLEEVGLFGTLLVVLIMLAISIPVLRLGRFPVVWTYFAALLINVGAAVFFSLGGVGFFMWLMIGFCYGQAREG